MHGDDAVIVEVHDTHFVGRAMYPGLRVLPDTLKQLFPEGIKVHGVAHYSQKLRIDLPLNQAGPLPSVPLGALVFLAPPRSDDQITLRPIRPAEACMAVIENSFALDPTDRERAREKLQMAGALADSVPAFELSYPRDYDRLDDVRRALVEAGILPPLDGDPASSGLRA